MDDSFNEDNSSSRKTKVQIVFDEKQLNIVSRKGENYFVHQQLGVNEMLNPPANGREWLISVVSNKQKHLTREKKRIKRKAKRRTKIVFSLSC